MRTRRLTCPIPIRRIHLQTEYFEKSVKKSLPRWLNRMQQWNDNNSQMKEHRMDRNIPDIDVSYVVINSNQKNKNSRNEEIKMDTLIVPSA